MIAAVGPIDDQRVTGSHEAEHCAGDLIGDVCCRRIGCQRRDVLAQAATHGLENGDVLREDALALDQPPSRLETVRTVVCMIGEISRGEHATKQHEWLARAPTRLSASSMSTQHVAPQDVARNHDSGHDSRA